MIGRIRDIVAPLMEKLRLTDMERAALAMLLFWSAGELHTSIDTTSNLIKYESSSIPDCLELSEDTLCLGERCRKTIFSDLHKLYRYDPEPSLNP